MFSLFQGKSQPSLKKSQEKPFQSLGQFRMLAPAMQNPKGVTVSEKRFRATGRTVSQSRGEQQGRSPVLAAVTWMALEWGSQTTPDAP